MLPHLRNRGRYTTESLIFGYIRLNYNQYIPYEIIRICHLFCNEIIHCSLDMERFTKLKNQHMHQTKFVFKGDTFFIRQHQFVYQIEGDEEHDYDQDQPDSDNNYFCIGISDKLLSNISQCLLYYEVYCHELKRGNIGTMKYDESDTQWQCVVLPYITNSIIDYDPCTQFFSNCQSEKLKSLSFDVYTDILYLIYKDKLKPIVEYTPVKLNSNIYYEWNIDVSSKFFDIGYTGQLFSTNFGFNNNLNDEAYSWYLKAIRIPNGCKVQLQFLCLPKDISKIDVSVKMENNYSERKVNKIVEYSMIDTNLNRWYHVQNTVRYDKYILNKLKILKFKVHIEIEKVYDLNQENVDKSKWKQFGIESNQL
eukprot:283010_1